MKREKWFHTLALCLLTAAFAACGSGGDKKEDTLPMAECPTFCADSAMKHIEAQCAFGPRVTGTEESKNCAEYIASRFREYGASVEMQPCTVTLWDKSKCDAVNIVASINPENKDRIMFCAHWDSRPWADNDPDEKNHHTPVLGANDGASGVAVMLELCRLLQQQPVRTGIDFVCFDAEDMGTPQWAETEESTSDTWCLGSYYWATQAFENGYKARFGILLDMVGGRGCVFPREQASVSYAGPVVEMVWYLAQQLGYGHYFPLTDGASLIDDHINVNCIARVPCLDIVPYFTDGPSSFGPTWHTVQDTPENIDPNVLEAVGQTVLQLIYNDNL